MQEQNKPSDSIAKKLQLLKNKNIEEKQAPVRARIKKVQEDLYFLTVIKGSLTLKSQQVPGSNSTESGIGMSEYKDSINSMLEEKEHALKDLFASHKDDLAPLGVLKWEDLLTNNEFKDGVEANEYNQAVEENEILAKTDTTLHERLKALDVLPPSNDFSYALATQAVDKKIGELKKELVEKTKEFPEERKKLLQSMILEYKLKPNGLKFNIKDNAAEDFDLTQDSIEKSQSDFFALEQKYGSDFAYEVLRETYRPNVHDQIRKYDNNNEHVLSLSEQIKAISPEVKKRALELLTEFQRVQVVCIEMLNVKSEELKGKGLVLDPVNLPNSYGLTYQEIIGLTSHPEMTQSYENSIKDEGFPPKFNLSDLSARLESRTEAVKNFTEQIKGIEDQESLKAFYDAGDKGQIAKLHFNLLHQKDLYNFKFVEENYDSSNKSPLKEVISKIRGSKTYEEAEKYLAEKRAKLQAMEDNVLLKVEYKSKDRHIYNKLEVLFANVREAENRNKIAYMTDVLRRTDKIEELKGPFNIAIDDVKERMRLYSDSEPVTINEWVFKINSFDSSIFAVESRIHQLEKELRDKIKEVKIKQEKNPGKDRWFSLSSKHAVWESELEKLMIEERDLSNNIKNEEEKLRVLKKESVLAMPNGDSFSMFLDRLQFTGTKAEVFQELERIVKEKTEPKFPPGALELYKQYQDLPKES